MALSVFVPVAKASSFSFFFNIIDSIFIIVYFCVEQTGTGDVCNCCLFTSVWRVFCNSAVRYTLPSNMGEASVISFCWWLLGYFMVFWQECLTPTFCPIKAFHT